MFQDSELPELLDPLLKPEDGKKRSVRKMLLKAFGREWPPHWW